jgi:D-alanine-D-alanine ligase
VAGSVINRTVNPRPWKSYQSVAEDIAAALRRIGFDHVWCLPEDMRLGARLRRRGIHLAWLNTGGVQGYGAVTHGPAMLEMLGVPYVGHDPMAAGILDNKHLFKRELMALGIPTSPFVVWHMAKGPFGPNRHPTFERTFGDHPGPFVVKPVSGRASHHVELVEDRAGLAAVVAKVGAATENHVLVESYLGGREYCTAVCGPVIARHGDLLRRSKAFTFAPIERLLAPKERIFTSMDVRPITTDRVRVLDRQLDRAALDQLQDLALRVFTELDLETLIRLDVRADDVGRLHVLEANPKPDLAAPRPERTSLIATGLAAHDMTYDDLIHSLLADRIDLLLSQRRGAAKQLSELLH